MEKNILYGPKKFDELYDIIKNIPQNIKKFNNGFDYGFLYYQYHPEDFLKYWDTDSFGANIGRLYVMPIGTLILMGRASKFFYKGIEHKIKTIFPKDLEQRV